MTEFTQPARSIIASRDPVMDPTSIEPLGDSALPAHFSTEASGSRWAAAARTGSSSGIRDVVLAYRTVAVFADVDQANLSDLEARLRAIKSQSGNDKPGRSLVIPVRYDGADLNEVAARLNLTSREVIAAHCSVEFDVFAVGFLPGFPYAGYLPPALAGLARRESPRLQVPAGSVAIAGRQTAVYPCRSPGGWHLLGTTPLLIADVETGYFPIQAGDRIRFQPIPAEEFAARLHERL